MDTCTTKLQNSTAQVRGGDRGAQPTCAWGKLSILHVMWTIVRTYTCEQSTAELHHVYVLGAASKVQLTWTCTWVLAT